MFDQQSNQWYFLISDLGLNVDMLLVAVFDCAGRKRTILCVAVGADPWPWPHSAGLLDADFHQRKSVDYEFEEGRLVVPHRHSEG